MKLQKEYIILAVVIAALALYLVVRHTDRTNYSLPQLAEISEKDITKLSIEKDGNSIVLNRKNDSWHIGAGEYRADKPKVKDMLEKIKTVTLTALVSESKNYMLYDLTDERKITVKAWTGKSLAREIQVGKTAPSYNHTFVKLAGDDRVYHARGSFKSSFERTIDDLRDKTVLSFDPNDIGEIQIDQDTRKMVLLRKPVPEKEALEQTEKTTSTEKTVKTVWQTADGKSVDNARLNRFLSELAGLNCQRYFMDKKKEDFTQPLCSIVLRGSRDHTLTLYGKAAAETQEYPAVSSESDDPFLLSATRAENILKTPEEILKGK